MTGVPCDLCDHPLLTVLLEEGVPGCPAHGRGGVQTVRQTQHAGQEDMEQQEGAEDSYMGPHFHLPVSVCLLTVSALILSQQSSTRDTMLLSILSNNCVDTIYYCPSKNESNRISIFIGKYTLFPQTFLCFYVQFLVPCPKP